MHNVVRHIHVSMVSFLHGLYCYYSISAYSFHDYLSLCGQLAGEISLQLSLKRFPSLGLQTNGNESNAILSRFRSNRKLTWTIYHWSVILRSFSVVSNLAKRNANGFFKVLLPFSYLLNSRHPVRKSKFGTCAVTGYCSFNSSDKGTLHTYIYQSWIFCVHSFPSALLPVHVRSQSWRSTAAFVPSLSFLSGGSLDPGLSLCSFLSISTTGSFGPSLARATHVSFGSISTRCPRGSWDTCHVCPHPGLSTIITIWTRLNRLQKKKQKI